MGKQVVDAPTTAEFDALEKRVAADETDFKSLRGRPVSAHWRRSRPGAAGPAIWRTPDHADASMAGQDLPLSGPFSDGFVRFSRYTGLN
jgi:hypothetical protein